MLPRVAQQERQEQLAAEARLVEAEVEEWHLPIGQLVLALWRSGLLQEPEQAVPSPLALEFSQLQCS